VSIDNESAIVNKTVVMDALEHIRVDIAVAARHEYTGLKLELVLFSALLLLMVTFICLRFVLLSRVVFTGHTTHSAVFIRSAPVLVLIFILFFLVINFIQLLEQKPLKVSIVEDLLRLVIIKIVTEVSCFLSVRLLLVFISDDLHKFDLLVDGDSEFFKH